MIDFFINGYGFIPLVIILGIIGVIVRYNRLSGYNERFNKRREERMKKRNDSSKM
jgi:hypothetical protein